MKINMLKVFQDLGKVRKFQFYCTSLIKDINDQKLKTDKMTKKNGSKIKSGILVITNKRNFAQGHSKIYIYFYFSNLPSDISVCAVCQSTHKKFVLSFSEKNSSPSIITLAICAGPRKIKSPNKPLWSLK